ncbi:MAG: hypothetical protein U1A77_19280 [Pirellulales bacterium]
MMTNNHEDKGRQHRDWHLSLLFIPLLSLSCGAVWGWRSQTQSAASAVAPQPTPLAPPQPLVGGERVAPRAAAEKIVLASWQDAQPFVLSKLTLADESQAARTRRLSEFLTALTNLRERTQQVLTAELSEPVERRSEALAKLSTQWESLKTTDKFQELVELGQWCGIRAQLWKARTVVASEIDRARELAKEERFVELDQRLQVASDSLQPLRDQLGFEEVLGELTPRLDKLKSQVSVLAAFKGAYDALPTAPEEREPRLLELVNRYQPDQPEGMEFDRKVGPKGRDLIAKAATEQAHLHIDLRFGSRPGATNPIVGNSAGLPVSERISLAKEIRDRYPRYPEITARLRQLTLSWLQQILVERSLPLQKLDPAFQEAVNVETNGLAIGLFIPDANAPAIWSYWRSSAERVRNPNVPEHRLTTQLEIGDPGLKRIAEPPRPLFLVTSIGDFNLSIQQLRASENLSSRQKWAMHVQNCQVWELEAATLRNRVTNFGLKGGGIQAEQALIEKAYTEMSFEAEWKQAQAIMAVFPSVESLLGGSPGTAP